MSKYPNTPGFKARGTSEDAADSMAASAPHLRWMALEWLKQFSMTSDEVADRVGVTPFAMRPRITELKKMGLLVCIGRRKNKSGRNANVYRTPSPGELTRWTQGQPGNKADKIMQEMAEKYGTVLYRLA